MTKIYYSMYEVNIYYYSLKYFICKYHRGALILSPVLLFIFFDNYFPVLKQKINKFKDDSIISFGTCSKYNCDHRITFIIFCLVVSCFVTSMVVVPVMTTSQVFKKHYKYLNLLEHERNQAACL